MSDPGDTVAPDIKATWLRDAVAAYSAVVRPTVILACGLAVAYAAVRYASLGEIVATAAALAGGVGFLRSMDKKTSTQAPA